MVIEGQPLFSHLGLKLDQAVNLVNRSFFGRAQDRDQSQNRTALVRATQEYFSKGLYVRAEVAVHRNHFDLLFAQSESFNDLLHRIVRGCGNQRQRGRDRLVSQLREEALNPLARDAVGGQSPVDLPVDLGLRQISSALSMGRVQTRAQLQHLIGVEVDQRPV